MKLEDARNFWRSRGVPEEAIEDLWTLAESARYNDASAEEAGSDIKRVLQDNGWHPAAAEYMAEQRCLRMMMVMRGQSDVLQKFARTFSPMAVNADETILAALATVWMDGFANAAKSLNLRRES